MLKEGPQLEKMTHRLSECPHEFLMEPEIGSTGVIHVDAVASDLLMSLGGSRLDIGKAELFQPKNKSKRNEMRLVLVTTWLLSDDWFRENKCSPGRIYDLLGLDLDDLGKLVNAELFVTDAEKREELVRLCLAALELKPKGETEEQALDRLESFSSIKRSRIISQMREKEERARKIREAMQAQQAREAAARYSPE